MCIIVIGTDRENIKVIKIINILEFIGKLTQHIHPKGFIVVRRD
ncbi:MAG: hypothetical protein RSC84_01600 [Peptostreptococcaceae bacterium]